MNDGKTGRSERKEVRHNLLRMLEYVRPYWFYYVCALITGAFKFASPLIIWWILGTAIDVFHQCQAGLLEPEAAWDQILRLATIGGCIAIINPVPSYIRRIVSTKAIVHVIRDVRCDLFSHVQKLSHSFFDKNRSGSLTSRIMSDVQSVQPFLDQTIVQIPLNVVTIVGVLIYFFRESVTLGVISVCLIPLQAVVFRLIGRRVKRLSRALRERMAWMSGNTQEKLAATTEVKTFTQEDEEIGRFMDDSGVLIDMGMKRAHLGAITETCISTIGFLAPLLVIVLGGRIALFHPEEMSPGLVVTFVLMQKELYSPFQSLSRAQITIANALGATDRIFEIFDTEPEIADKHCAKKAPRFRGEIVFDKVEFTYPLAGGNKILNAVDLFVPERTTLALVGPSGGGKSTMARLINRFYDVEAGRIMIDGNDIRDYTVHSLRYQIGLVPQDPMLFSGTVEENILYGNPRATAEEVRHAARNAFAYDFIEGLQDGFDTIVGERGVILSGGQRQRIAIARAFLKNPAILILDEATSALDSESEAYIHVALKELMKSRTSVVIAHRLSTVIHAHQIAVIEDGSVVDTGKHDELYARGGLYTTLCQKQFVDGSVKQEDAEGASGRIDWVAAS